MKTRFVWLAGLLLAASLLSLMVGCDRQEQSVTAPVEVTQIDQPDLSAPSEQGEKAYPPYSFSLNVPFTTQVPPGEWANTKNCGQTCVAMLGGYFNGSAVNSTAITSQNSWLAAYTGNIKYNQANGWYTSMSQLKAILEQKHRLHTSYPACTTLQQLINVVASGKPCIVGVRISGGKLVASGGVDHWALVVGWNGNVIVNDPGSSSGNHRSYSVAAFDASWATSGRNYMAVWR